jgi:hypothetical protein
VKLVEVGCLDLGLFWGRDLGRGDGVISRD